MSTQKVGRRCGGSGKVDWTFGNPSPKVPCPGCVDCSHPSQETYTREQLESRKALEALAKAQWELSDPDADHNVAPKKDHPGSWDEGENGVKFLYEGNAHIVLRAALDAIDKGKGDDDV